MTSFSFIIISFIVANFLIYRFDTKWLAWDCFRLLNLLQWIFFPSDLSALFWDFLKAFKDSWDCFLIYLGIYKKISGIVSDSFKTSWIIWNCV